MQSTTVWALRNAQKSNIFHFIVFDMMRIQTQILPVTFKGATIRLETRVYKKNKVIVLVGIERKKRI